MRVGRVGDAGFAQVADVFFVFLDLYVATRQRQRDGGHVVDRAIAEGIELDALLLQHLAAAPVELVAGTLPAGPQSGVLNAHLLDEGQVILRDVVHTHSLHEGHFVFGRFRRHLRRDLDARFNVWTIYEHGCSFGNRKPEAGSRMPGTRCRKPEGGWLVNGKAPGGAQ